MTWRPIDYEGALFTDPEKLDEVNETRLESVERGFKREFESLPHVFPASCENECGECDACDNTASFSWHLCEVCSGLPGERYPLVAFERIGLDSTEAIYFSVCEDCYFYAAYGEINE